MGKIFKAIRYSSLGVFFAGTISFIQGCSQSDINFAFIIWLIFSLLSGGADAPAPESDPVNNVTVSSSNTQGWVGFSEGGSPPAPEFISGPGTPPLGTGSLELELVNNDDRSVYAIANNDLLFSEITQLSYSTYFDSASNCATNLRISLQFNYDPDITDATTGWFGRLVFEPVNTPAFAGQLASDTWQTWDTLAGNWWASGNATSTVDDACPIGSPCSWSDIITNFPNIGLNTDPGLGAILLKAGGPWNCNFIGSADALTIIKNDGTGVVYDFEP